MKLFKCSEKQLRDAIFNSVSIRGALLKLGVSPYGGNYEVFKKAVLFYNIDTSHFLGKGWNVFNSPSEIKPIEKYLSNEITISSFKLKNRLIKEKIKELRCECCNRRKWNNKDIPLELHHMNCNNKDNSLNNLKLLCPNCHALTDGYRNRK